MDKFYGTMLPSVSDRAGGVKGLFRASTYPLGMLRDGPRLAPRYPSACSEKPLGLVRKTHLMQMAEVDYEIMPYVDYIVGSEETEPGDGYTYNTFLGPVAAKPTMTPMEVAKQTVNAYADHYDGIKQGHTQSLVRSASVAKLLTLSDAFTAAVIASGEKALAKTSRDAAVNFAMDENRDLYDFTRRVVEGSANADVKVTGQALMNFITGELVLVNRTRDSQGGYWSGPKPYTLAKGIAAYFPSYTLGAGYADLAWAKASQWDEFVTWINQP